MKKAVFTISLLFAVLSRLHAQAPFTCTTNNGAITITGYSGPSGVVTIPSTINGFPVTTIGPYAFEISGINPPVIKSVIFSNGVTAIGDHSFAFNLSMTNVTLPASLNDIGMYAFVGSPNLRNVVIPAGVTNIAYSAFYNCAFTNFTIPGNVITVGDEAFSSCSALTNVIINYGVESLGAKVFSGTPLTSVTIPASVTNIGKGPLAFDGCYSLTAIWVDSGNPFFSSLGGVLYNSNQTAVVKFPAGLAGSFTVPNIVNSLGDYAFLSCTNLISINLSNTTHSLLSIGNYCFANTVLSNGTIPGSVTHVGSFVFSGCKNLAAITVDPQNAYYSVFNGVLFDKGQTTLVEAPFGLTGNYSVPTTVTSIGTGAFAYCSGLTGIKIPDAVTNIGNNAFYGCSSLTNVTISNTPAILGSSTFAFCNHLTAVYFYGNAPVGDASVFLLSSPTIYYLPGTTGWGLNFAGRPAVLWTAQPQGVTIQSNQLGFTIVGTTNIPIVVAGCTNLMNANWSTLQTCTLTNGSIRFSDSQWTNYPRRYFRITPP